MAIVQLGPSMAADIRAAIYVRMSTESQNYSTNHQRTRIRDYAASTGMQIVREYADEGKSGLDIKRRAGLSNLIKDVQEGVADFSVIIVYDVSRWGRFQDVDEAGYHEHTCRRAGIQVVYCAEPFNNDGSPFAALLKNMKRTMAAEYSRELSDKVFSAQCRFIKMGFKQGGHAGYGLRRVAVTEKGVPRSTLEYGERKGVLTDRVVLVRGPDHEVATVRRIYSLYLDEGLSACAIARVLNSENIASEFGRPWTSGILDALLTNAKYSGALVFNRRSAKLSIPRGRNPPQEWIINSGAIEQILAPGVYDRAQLERARRGRRYSAAELLVLLRTCYQTHGKVTSNIILADPSMPDPQTFSRTFGSLVEAYDIAGIPPTQPNQVAATRSAVLAIRRALFAQVCSLVQNTGATVIEDTMPFALTINEQVRLRVEIAACRRPDPRIPYWHIHPRAGIDFTIVARLDQSNRAVLDYFLIAAGQLPSEGLYLMPSGLSRLEQVRFCSIEAVFGKEAMTGKRRNQN